MTKNFKLYKWKKDTWVIYDETRDHGNSENQNPWYPSFYRLLKSFKKGTILSVLISDSASIKKESSDYRYKISQIRKNNPNPNVTVYEKMNSKDKEYLVRTSELMELFGYVPGEVVFSILE